VGQPRHNLNRRDREVVVSGLRQPGARTIDGDHASASVKTSTGRLFAISRDSDHGFMWLGSDIMPKKN
jgi:hypothetical protein